ncbi:MAG: alpha-mannosidase [Clostridiales bacterium]|nr:alpha-mannosidase [Clostridiales bacterium]
MNYEKYTEKLLKQYDLAMNVYAQQIFVPIKLISHAQALKTKEHLRTPPSSNLFTIREGDTWGSEWENLWLCFDVELAQDWAGKQIWLIPHTGATEILCFRDGVPCGLINSKHQFIGGWHSALFVSSCASPLRHRMALECYAGHYFPGTQPYENYGRDRAEDSNSSGVDICVQEEQQRNCPDNGQFQHVFSGIDICVMDEKINQLVFDLLIVLQLAHLPKDNFMHGKAIRTLKKAFPHFIQDPLRHTMEEIHESAENVCAILAEALEKRPCEYDGSRGMVGVVGHSHMDTAWLWPVNETIRKCARTYSQALSLMDRYPDYNFIQSSALHLWWMETYYPAIFEGIMRRVAEGRYEPNGGVWVECDCNMTGSEAMVRQFFYGQKYTKEKLGYLSDSFWLPDTFGYNAAIPQIMRQSGVKYFYTTKISWNDLNTMGADSFIWKGLDGSEVFTHLNLMHRPPDVKEVNTAIESITDKTTSDCKLLAYGFGDGGGGPTYGMLENLKRIKDLPGMPKVRPMSVSRFMQELEEKKDDLPVYDGELYLEFHRGTLTSIHDIKRNNRKAEHALHNLEFLNAASGKEMNPETERLYKVLLKNQFHDILPGSSIQEVNDTAIQEMNDLLCEISAETKKYLGAESPDTHSFINPTSFPWKESDVLEAEGTISVAGATCQPYTDVMGRERTSVSGLCVPSYGAAAYSIGEAAPNASPFQYDKSQLETPFYRVRFDSCGYISSLVEKETGREYRRMGGEPLGTLWMGENMPDAYDNWEIAPSQEMKMTPVRTLLSREVASQGPVSLRIRSVYALSPRSTATVDTVFYAASRGVGYHMRVDWQDKHYLLKVGFDVDVKASQVKNEIQFGFMERPTTRNTSLDTAKFEVVNHKWSDLSDSRGGVAILNDCKYGISACGTDLRLTLMHSGCRPDPRGDAGIHEMSYTLLPHIGPFSTENVIAPAYKLNLPLIHAKGRCDLPSLFTLDCDHVICETVKCAESGENAYVLRLYECEGVPAACTLTLPGASKAARVNLLEEEQEALSLDHNQVKLQLRPFEICSILVHR